MTLIIPRHRTRCSACGEIRYCAPLETVPVAGISIDEDGPGIPTPMLCIDGPEACMGYWNLLQVLGGSPLADIAGELISTSKRGPLARVRELFFEQD